jgi:Asp/Glu/hydantoin racemase
MKMMNINELIQKRAYLTSEIEVRWDIILEENLALIEDKDKRTMDLMQAYKEIKELSKQRVEVKILLQCANMGIIANQLEPTANVWNIYNLTEVNEAITKLESIKTVHHNVAKRYGNAITICDVLSEAFVKAEKHAYILRRNQLKMLLKQFNENTLESLNVVVD